MVSSVSGFWVELHPKSSGGECIFCHKMGRASHNSAGYPPNNDIDDDLDNDLDDDIDDTLLCST